MKCFECGNDTGNPRFCSRSCAVTFNNRLTPKKGVGPYSLTNSNGTCNQCGNKLIGNQQKYCSMGCAAEGRQAQTISDWLSGKVIITDLAIRGTKGPYKNFILKQQDNLCDICGINDVWNGKPIVSILDHIDGDSNNNVRNNVRMICPNCSAQLPTNGGGNKGFGRKLRYKLK